MTSFLLSKPSGDDQLPGAQLGFVAGKLRNDLHAVVLREFKSSGLTQAELAKRLGKDKAWVSRTLGAPGNWTIDTAATLIFAINGSVLIVGSVDVDHPARSNFTKPAWLSSDLPPPPSTADGSGPVVMHIRQQAIQKAPDREIVTWGKNRSAAVTANTSPKIEMKEPS